MAYLYEGEGKRLTFTIEEGGSAKDISSATSKKFRVKKHLGDDSYTMDKTMSFDSDGSDGKVYVDIVDSDTEGLSGNYIYEVELVIGGVTYTGKIDLFTVMKRVES